MFAGGERRVGYDVVDWVVDAVAGGVPDGALVHEDPLVDWRDVCDHGHAGAGLVEVVGYVVDDGAPRAEVGGLLVGELLTVQWVALVGVVGGEDIAVLSAVWSVNSSQGRYRTY